MVTMPLRSVRAPMSLSSSYVVLIVILVVLNRGSPPRLQQHKHQLLTQHRDDCQHYRRLIATALLCGAHATMSQNRHHRHICRPPPCRRTCSSVTASCWISTSITPSFRYLSCPHRWPQNPSPLAPARQQQPKGKVLIRQWAPPCSSSSPLATRSSPQHRRALCTRNLLSNKYRRSMVHPC